MKLTAKIMSLIFIVIIALLLVDGYFSIQRQITLFDNDMKRDMHLLGVVLTELVINIWKSDGLDRALELIDDVNQRERKVFVRWVRLDAASGDPYEPRVSREKLEPVIPGEEISFYENGQDGTAYFYMYSPIQNEFNDPVALELSESLADRRDYIRESVIRLLRLIGVMMLVSAFLLWQLGTKLIGRPLNQLVEKTHRIGAGDLTSDIILQGHNELSALALAMNQMCEQLAEAQETIYRETEKRIATLEQLRHTERLATLGKLSSGIAHELGTPLNIVAGRAKLISAQNLDKKEILKSAMIIREQADRMTQIIKQVLEFARRKPVHRSSVNIYQFVSQVNEMMKPIAEKSRVSFELGENRDIPPVLLDRFQVQQVLVNIMMNGIHAMPDGGKIKIELNQKSLRSPLHKNSNTENFLIISIKDEGVGISEKDMKQIFEPFFTTKGTYKGTGLGLSIAHDIIEEHNGWIDVESKLGEGTCVNVYLPMKEQS